MKISEVVINDELITKLKIRFGGNIYFRLKAKSNYRHFDEEYTKEAIWSDSQDNIINNPFQANALEGVFNRNFPDYDLNAEKSEDSTRQIVTEDRGV